MTRLTILCLISCIISIVVAVLGIRDLIILPSSDSLPTIISVDQEIQDAGKTKLDTILIRMLEENSKGAKDIEQAAKISIELARDGAKERIVIGFGFAVVFLLLIQKTNRAKNLS